MVMSLVCWCLRRDL